MAKNKKPQFGYDGWAAVLVCMAVYSSAIFANFTDMSLPKSAMLFVGAWVGSVFVFTETHTETYHKWLKQVIKILDDCFHFILQFLLWMFDETQTMINEVEGTTVFTIHFYIPIRQKTTRFVGQGINREVGLGWATGSYELHYVDNLNERRLDNGILVHRLSVPFHKRYMFVSQAGLKKQTTYQNGVVVESPVFQTWDGIK